MKRLVASREGTPALVCWQGHEINGARERAAAHRSGAFLSPVATSVANRWLPLARQHGAWESPAPIVRLVAG